MINIMLVDDHALVRDGIKALLEEENEFNVIDEAFDGIEALNILKKRQPDLMIADITMPKMNGIELIKIAKEQYADLKTLVLSMHDSEEYVLNAIDTGADGFLLKGSSKVEFLKALQSIANGGKYFSGDISSIIINNLTRKSNNTTPQNTSLDNPYHLTKREKQILKLVLKGKSNKEIALELEMSKRTAEVHRFNLMKKLNVKNLIELSNKASEFKF